MSSIGCDYTFIDVSDTGFGESNFWSPICFTDGLLYGLLVCSGFGGLACVLHDAACAARVSLRLICIRRPRGPPLLLVLVLPLLSLPRLLPPGSSCLSSALGFLERPSRPAVPPVLGSRSHPIRRCACPWDPVSRSVRACWALFDPRGNLVSSDGCALRVPGF